MACNVPVTINSSYICATANCPGSVKYSLKDPLGAVTTGSVPLAFTPTITGNYTLTLYGYCGNYLCDSCKITFFVTCACDCGNSHWGTNTYTTAGAVKQFACNATAPVPVTCNVPITINSTFVCGGNNCPGTVSYKLTNPLGGITMGAVPLTFTPATSGNYTVMLYGYCGTKLCDSCKITFVVQCDGCVCTNSYWGSTTYTVGGLVKVAQCFNDVILACNVPVTVGSSYICGGTNCPGTVKYSLTDPLGGITTWTMPLTFTPSITGTYSLTLFGYCGTKLCSTCKITFYTQCPTDCNCTGSHWGDISMVYGQPPTAKPLVCGQQYDLACNAPVTINANYLCNGANCPGSVKYTLTTPSGTSSGTAPFTFTPTVSGTYTLVLSGYCGSKLCATCTITFKVVCPPLCNCTGSKWGDIWMTGGGANQTFLTCNKEYNVQCNTPVTVNAFYMCLATNCVGSVKYSLKDPNGVVTTGPVSFTFTPTLSGIYTLTLYGYCGTNLCDSCKITFKMACCTCEGSTWGGIAMKQGNLVKSLKCNGVYEIACTTPILVAATYNCKGTSCPGKVTYALTAPNGTMTTGPVNVGFIPNQTGTYTLMLYGYCGDTKCDSCKITFKVDCCTCEGSKWGAITMTSGTPPTSKPLKCNETYAVPCNVPITINASYLCGLQNCQSAVTYQLTAPSGAVTTGSGPLTFNPTQTGTYTLVLSGYCGGKLCNTCVIRFKVACCNCDNSQWGLIDMIWNDPPVQTALQCNRQYTLPCGKPVRIAASYFCSQENCQSPVTYQLTSPSGVVTTVT